MTEHRLSNHLRNADQRNPAHSLCPNRAGAGIDETAKIWSPRGELVATLEDHEYWVEEHGLHAAQLATGSLNAELMLVMLAVSISIEY